MMRVFRSVIEKLTYRIEENATNDGPSTLLGCGVKCATIMFICESMLHCGVLRVVCRWCGGVCVEVNVQNSVYKWCATSL